MAGELINKRFNFYINFEINDVLANDTIRISFSGKDNTYTTRSCVPDQQSGTLTWVSGGWQWPLVAPVNLSDCYIHQDNFNLGGSNSCDDQPTLPGYQFFGYGTQY